MTTIVFSSCSWFRSPFRPPYPFSRTCFYCVLTVLSDRNQFVGQSIQLEFLSRFVLRLSAAMLLFYNLVILVSSGTMTTVRARVCVLMCVCVLVYLSRCLYEINVSDFRVCTHPTLSLICRSWLRTTRSWNSLHPARLADFACVFARPPNYHPSVRADPHGLVT